MTPGVPRCRFGRRRGDWLGERAFFLAAGQKGSAVPEMVESSLAASFLSLNPVPLPFWFEDREGGGGEGCVATLPPHHQGSVKEKASPPHIIVGKGPGGFPSSKAEQELPSPFLHFECSFLPKLSGGKVPELQS